MDIPEGSFNHNSSRVYHFFRSKNRPLDGDVEFRIQDLTEEFF